MKCPACKWSPPALAEDTCELCGLRGVVAAWKAVLYLAWVVPVTIFALLYAESWAKPNRWMCPTCQRERLAGAVMPCWCGEEGGPVPVLDR